MQVAEVNQARKLAKRVNGEFPIENLDPMKIKADNRAQPRKDLNTDMTQAYAEAMADGAVFPPVIVFFDGDDYWLADGFHRRYAAMSILLASIPCEVRAGGLRDAILFSCQVNATHGVQRSSEDKRRAVTKLLQDDEWSHWSDREIASHARVDHKTVARIRAELTPPSGKPEARTYTTKHGTVATRKVITKSGAESGPSTSIPTPSKPTPTRTATAPSPQKSPSAGKAAICDRVREAITILSGLPPAHEVADYFAGTDAAIIVSERIVPAAAWVAAFSAAWKDSQC